MIVVLFVTTAAAAQGPPSVIPNLPPQSTISMRIAGLGCSTALGANTFSVLTYSFGGSQDTSASGGGGGGGGAGKPNILPLSATKNLDACSLSLLVVLLQGAHIATVDLVQQDTKGNPILTINLTDVLVGLYQTGGSVSSDTPQETIHLDFKKICISAPGNNTKCYDRSTNVIS
jgi:type VI protein secretion system component Hcp